MYGQYGKWKGKEQCQNPQHRADKKFKECVEIHNIMELKRLRIRRKMQSLELSSFSESGTAVA